jgi:hypothetical protein
MDGFTLTPLEFSGNGNPPKSPPDSTQADSPCRRCGSRCVSLRWKRFADGTRHIEEKCLTCLRWRGWARQTPEAVAKAQSES